MTKKKTTNLRALAARVVHGVAYNGNSLSIALPAAVNLLESKNDKALLQELCYGTVRNYFQLDAIKKQLVPKPLKKKDSDVSALILVGLYQLVHMRTPDHAAVSETVNAVMQMEKTWYKALVNGVLRKFIRDKENLLNSLQSMEPAMTNHPAWMLERFKNSWPHFWLNIVEANNQHPPMALRINQQKTNRSHYQARLSEAGIPSSEIPYVNSGLMLQLSVDTNTLPDFEHGVVSVQDGAAQLVASLMDITEHSVVLDLCAAPGGKTCHMLEMTNPAFLLASDIDYNRVRKVVENSRRLNLSASIVCGDGLRVSHWCKNAAFDRILLDAPCSGSGVIRRHPDIKLLRRESDITQFANTQLALLIEAWSVLKNGGILLYTTCSIFPQENWLLIETFLSQFPDAHPVVIDENWGHSCSVGRQILPGENAMDGFYYAKLRKV